MMAQIRRIVLPLLLLTCMVMILSCAKKEAPKAQDEMNVYKLDGRYGYRGFIDGQPASIDPKFSFAFPFSGGLAVVELDHMMTYINMKGKFVFPGKWYERAYDFSEGQVPLARVKNNGKFGYINRSGELVINYAYDNAWDFRNGKAKVRIDTKTVYYIKGKIKERTETRSFFIDAFAQEITNFSDADWTNFSGKPNRY